MREVEEEEACAGWGKKGGYMRRSELVHAL